MRSLSLMTVAVLMAVAPLSLAQPGGDGGGPADDDTNAGGGTTETSASSDATGPPDQSGSDTGGGGSDAGGGAPASSTSSASAEYCDNNGTSAHYEETLSGNGTSMEREVVTDTGCPNHINIQINPNSASVNPVTESIPAYPMLFADGGTTDLSDAAMSVGIMRNGVALFSAWGGKETVVDYETTAFFVESDTFDLCAGHATTDGTYHYHSTPGCLQEHAMVVDGTTVEEHSPILGWSYDGFPVYGQLGPDGVEMIMCGEDGADATYCLDSCSGYEGELAGTDEFKYRYYTSCGFDEAFFPFVVNCFRGCCPDGMTCNNHVEACGDTPEEGYTADYVPAATTSLDELYETTLIEGEDTDFLFDKSAIMDCSLYVGSAVTTSDVSTDGTPSPAAVSTEEPATGVTVSPAEATTTPSPRSAATSDTSSGATPSPAPIITGTPAPSSSLSPAEAATTPVPSSSSADAESTNSASGLLVSSSMPSLVVAAFVSATAAAAALWGV